MDSKVFLMDCMEGMKQYPAKYFDLAVVDPEYGINASKGTWGSSNRGKVKNYGKKDWDKNSVRKEILSEIIRVSKNQIIWGANHFISKIPFDSSCWIVWDKLTGGEFADCELAWTSFPTAVRKFTYTWNGFRQGPTCQVVEKRIHPTQKPVALYDWIYKNYLPNGGKVLDTHLGSGSNRISADKAGNIDFTGYELDPDYYAGQEKRFNDFKLQLRLF
jgi:site-specific DNA-methyltransferase (adenine-specific)